MDEKQILGEKMRNLFLLLTVYVNLSGYKCKMFTKTSLNIDKICDQKRAKIWSNILLEHNQIHAQRHGQRHGQIYGHIHAKKPSLLHD